MRQRQQQRKTTDDFISPTFRPEPTRSPSGVMVSHLPKSVRNGRAGPGFRLQVRSGQPVPDVTVRMVAAASISGRVADSNGQPLPNAQVQALKSTFQGELRMLIPVQQVRTNVDTETSVSTGFPPAAIL